MVTFPAYFNVWNSIWDIKGISVGPQSTSILLFELVDTTSYVPLNRPWR
jgi:hypothetical protein